MIPLHDLYLERVATPSDINEHLSYMHDIVVEQHAQNVVELGVRSGNSSVAFLAAVEQTDGQLWSVDIDLPTQVLDEVLADRRWKFNLGNDLELADRLPEQIDVLFIDTSHHYEHTLAELSLYGPRSATILLHDTELERPHLTPRTDPPFPVKAAIETWCAEVGRRWDNRTNCYGLGTIYPREEV